MIQDFRRETLIIDHFGPIEHATLEIKDINVFIGPTSSGKSTAAKLLAIFREREMLSTNRFRELLMHYNIAYEIQENTRILYTTADESIEFSKDGLNKIFIRGNGKNIKRPIYIPAERIFFPVISQSIFGLFSNNIALPRCFLDFGAQFEKARKDIQELYIDFLDVTYLFQDGIDYVQVRDGVKVKLSEAASGLQSIIPLLLVLKYRRTANDLFVVEEPELNLYPSAQKALMEILVADVKEAQSKLIITTHSPYLLTSLDNLIQAMNIAEENESKKWELDKIVPRSNWISFGHVSCYYFKDGKASSTLDPEMKSIGPSNIDDVSNDLSATFEKLLKLKYASI